MVIQDAAACVVEKWTGEQVETKLARGYPGAVSGKVSSLWLWLPLCVLFLAPFIDPRRPLRLIHLDLLALLGFSVSLAFFNHAKVEASVGLVYPVLAYLFVRMLIAGFRPTDRRDRLLPVAPRGLLVAGIVALIAFHTAYMATEGKVIDVGLAGVVGADRLTHGEDVYGEGASSGMPIRGDVYGPVNYLAYVPFELALPWSGRWDDVAGRPGGGARLRAAHRPGPFRPGPASAAGRRGGHPRRRPGLRLARLSVHDVHARLELQRRAGCAAGGLLPAGR